MKTYNDEVNEFNEKEKTARETMNPDDFQKWLENNPFPRYNKAYHNQDLKACIKDAKGRNAKRKLVFCPMIKGICNVACECYEKATVRNVTYEEKRFWEAVKTKYNEIDEVKPQVSGGFCTNISLKGGGYE